MNLSCCNKIPLTTEFTDINPKKIKLARLISKYYHIDIDIVTINDFIHGGLYGIISILLGLIMSNNIQFSIIIGFLIFGLMVSISINNIEFHYLGKIGEKNSHELGKDLLDFTETELHDWINVNSQYESTIKYIFSTTIRHKLQFNDYLLYY